MYRVIIIFGLLAVLAGGALADPRMLGERGARWLDGSDFVSGPACVTNSLGEEFCVWQELHTDRDVWKAQLIHANGIRAWEDSGRVLFVREGIYTTWGGRTTPEAPAVAAAANGWLVTYSTTPVDDAHDVYVQRITPQGDPVWSANDFGGVRIGTTTPAFLADDGAGGALLLWVTWSSPAYAINVQRVLANGSVAWDPPPLIESPGVITSDQVVDADAAGNLYIGWSRIQAGISTARASKVGPDGSLLWGGIGGVEVVAGDSSRVPFTIVADGVGGAYVVIRDQRTDTAGDCYAQHLNASGVATWTPLGVAVDGRAGYDGAALAALSRVGETRDGLLVAWEHEPADGSQHTMRVQKLSSDGSVLWGEQGNSLSEHPAIDQNLTDLLSDGFGGAVVTWPTTDSLRAARVASTGEMVWGAPEGLGLRARGYYGMTTQLNWGGPDWLHLAMEDAYYHNHVLMATRISMLDGGASPDLVDTLACESPTTSEEYYHFLRLDVNRYALVTEYLNVQVVDTLGHTEFGPDGQHLMGRWLPIGYVWETVAVADGAGGFYAAWIVVTAREGNQIDEVRVIHVNSDLEVTGGPTGVVIDTSTSRQYNINYLRCAADGNGGCHLAWNLALQGVGWVTKLAHVNAQCEQIRPVVTLPTYDYPDIVPSVEGRVIYSDWSTADGHYLRCIADNEAIVWQTLIYPGAPHRHFRVVSDGAGGVYAVGADAIQRDMMLYAQHIDADGTVLWGDFGAPVTTSPRRIGHYEPLTSSAGDLFVLWADSTTVPPQFRAQCITPDDQRLWPNAGQTVFSLGAYTYDVGIVAGSARDFFVTWYLFDDAGNGSLRGTHIGSNGLVADPWWDPLTGGDLGFRIGAWSGIGLVSDGVGGLMMSCKTVRVTGTSDTACVSRYVQRIRDDYVDSASDRSPRLPHEFDLAQNFPNPFNPLTEIRFTLPFAARTELTVFDLLGRTVATLIDDELTAGEHRVNLDASELASGIYFYRLRAQNFSATRKLVLLK
jgi:hypothetical protein